MGWVPVGLRGDRTTVVWHCSHLAFVTLLDYRLRACLQKLDHRLIIKQEYRVIKGLAVNPY